MPTPQTGVKDDAAVVTKLHSLINFEKFLSNNYGKKYLYGIRVNIYINRKDNYNYP